MAFGPDISRDLAVRWLAREVLPHEGDVRRWLARSMARSAEVDDVIQEAYCRLADIDDPARIASPRAYFFQTARSVVLEQMRRQRIVRFETVTEIDALNIEWDEPSPERIAGGRKELERVMQIINRLPDRCRRIFEMRRIMGLSQKEIARQLDVSENVVENEATRGLKAILAALAGEEASAKARRKA